MLLYKYVSYDAGLNILRNNSIGFTAPVYFNDPFEIEAESYDPDPSLSSGRQAGTRILASAIKSMAKHTGVLSLTRAPLNPLMWAHYGLGHTGMVIGIDAAKSELVSEATNLLPVQYGGVIYTNERPRARLLSQSRLALGGSIVHFQKDSFEHLQRIFLFKPMCWSYEEEVRVVKNVHSVSESGGRIASGSFSVITVAGRPMYLLDLPRAALREVYLGIRSEPIKQSNERLFVESVLHLQPDITVFGCKIGESSWNLEKYRITAEHQDIDSRRPRHG